MLNAPQYMSIFVRDDGEEYGVFCFGGNSGKYQSMFPSDLVKKSKTHTDPDEAVSYISRVWMEDTGVEDKTAFGKKIAEQHQFEDASELVH